MIAWCTGLLEGLLKERRDVLQDEEYVEKNKRDRPVQIFDGGRHKELFEFHKGFIQRNMDVKGAVWLDDIWKRFVAYGKASGRPQSRLREEITFEVMSDPSSDEADVLETPLQ